MELGDYSVEPVFATDFNRAEAENLIPRIAGPSFKEIRERQQAHTISQLPRHQVQYIFMCIGYARPGKSWQQGSMLTDSFQNIGL